MGSVALAEVILVAVVVLWIPGTICLVTLVAWARNRRTRQMVKLLGQERFRAYVQRLEEGRAEDDDPELQAVKSVLDRRAAELARRGWILWCYGIMLAPSLALSWLLFHAVPPGTPVLTISFLAFFAFLLLVTKGRLVMGRLRSVMLFVAAVAITGGSRTNSPWVSVVIFVALSALVLVLRAQKKRQAATD